MAPKTSEAQSPTVPLQEKDANTKTPLKGASDNAKATKSKKRSQPDHPNDDNNENENPPNAKKQKETPTANSSKKVAKKSDSKEDYTPEDLTSIHLPKEDEGRVPIYDTCDDIRKKINDHLRRLPHATQAAFARTLTAIVPREDMHVESRHLGKFLKGKGPLDGGHNPVFYAAYVYFEKIRQLQGKAKSKKRLDMEEEWAPKGGVPREGSHNMRITCFGGEKASLDRLGRLKITGGGGMGLSRKRVK